MYLNFLVRAKLFQLCRMCIPLIEQFFACHQIIRKRESKRGVMRAT